MFGTSQVQYMHYIIDEKIVHVDLAKIHVIRDWLALTTLPKLHSFLGLTIFNQQFVLGLSRIT